MDALLTPADLGTSWATSDKVAENAIWVGGILGAARHASARTSASGAWRAEETVYRLRAGSGQEQYGGIASEATCLASKVSGAAVVADAPTELGTQAVVVAGSIPIDDRNAAQAAHRSRVWLLFVRHADTLAELEVNAPEAVASDDVTLTTADLQRLVQRMGARLEALPS